MASYPLDLDADRAAGTDRAGLLNPDDHSLHSGLTQADPGDVGRKCLDGEPLYALGVSRDFLGHRLIVDAVANVVGCASQAKVGKQAQVDDDLLRRFALGIVDANDPSHHEVVDKDLAHFCCPHRPARRSAVPDDDKASGKKSPIGDQRRYQEPTIIPKPRTVGMRIYDVESWEDYHSHDLLGI